MDSSGPKRTWWWVALLIWAGVILGAVGILAYLLPIRALLRYSFQLLALGWLLLAVWAAAAYLRIWS